MKSIKFLNLFWFGWKPENRDNDLIFEEKHYSTERYISFNKYNLFYLQNIFCSNKAVLLKVHYIQEYIQKLHAD